MTTASGSQSPDSIDPHQLDEHRSHRGVVWNNTAHCRVFPEKVWCVLVEYRQCWDLTQEANSRHQSMAGENVVQKFGLSIVLSRPSGFERHELGHIEQPPGVLLVGPLKGTSSVRSVIRPLG